MSRFDETPVPDEDTKQLARLANTLGLNIAPEDLAALSKQLDQLGALDRDELQDYPPILKMDADWYD